MQTHPDQVNFLKSEKENKNKKCSWELKQRWACRVLYLTELLSVMIEVNIKRKNLREIENSSPVLSFSDYWPNVFKLQSFVSLISAVSFLRKVTSLAKKKKNTKKKDKKKNKTFEIGWPSFGERRLLNTENRFGLSSLVLFSLRWVFGAFKKFACQSSRLWEEEEEEEEDEGRAWPIGHRVLC